MNRQPLLPMDLEIEDARGAAKAGEDLYICLANDRYFVKARVLDFSGIVWDTLFPVTIVQARKIVKEGIAKWHWGIPDNYK